MISASSESTSARPKSDMAIVSRIESRKVEENKIYHSEEEALRGMWSEVVPYTGGINEISTEAESGVTYSGG